MLRQQGFLYDSSAAWSALMPLIKGYHRLFSKKGVSGEFGQGSLRVPTEFYFPDRSDWRTRGADFGGIMEIPIPRSSWLNLPFYNNFHLLVGGFYRDVSVLLMRQSTVVYLMHLIEFVDLEDGIPRELRIHPNVSTPVGKKMEFLECTLRLLKAKYKTARSDDFCKSSVEENSLKGSPIG